MALSGQEILYFMSVGASTTPIPDQSFEELRVQDYLKAYQSTAQHPQPCPQSPDTPVARQALGLPPLFVPAAIPVPNDKLDRTTSTDPPQLPTNHEFQSTKTLTGEFFESISAQSLFSHFSHEELRNQAYLSGNKMPPISSPSIVGAMEDGNGSTSTSAVPQFYANDSRTTAYLTSTAVPGTPDYMMSIVASYKFEKHSFEVGV
ncbi:hypothetical protein JVU11DRAFT_7552 [Chiua virens]|nr:hypothetical protein JVU11DRAFT_7552 [Chiua virens]